jgi:hypothetical protein
LWCCLFWQPFWAAILAKICLPGNTFGGDEIKRAKNSFKIASLDKHTRKGRFFAQGAQKWQKRPFFGVGKTQAKNRVKKGIVKKK